MPLLKSILTPEAVVFLDEKSREGVLKALVNHLYKTEKLGNPDTFYKAIVERESLASTGIGMGVALPHAKLDTIDTFFVVLAKLSYPVEWNSIDQSPVRAVFLIGGPENLQTEYLQLLSEITQMLRDEDRRKKLFNLKSSQDILNLFDD